MKMFIKQKNESYELVNKDTGELTELVETYVLNEELWYRLYVEVFASACDNLTGNAIKTFAKCIKHAKEDKGDGNYIYITDIYFKKDLGDLSQNLSKYIKELVDAGFLYKKSRGLYVLNPQLVYCGEKHNRGKAILKLIKENNAINNRNVI
jgi:hypothetical protein